MFGKDNYRRKIINSFALGLNTKDNQEEILDTELSDCENIEVDESTVKNAGGYIQYGDFARGKYWGIYQFKKSDGTQTLIRQRGTILEYDLAGVWTACTLPTTGSPASPVTLTETYCTFTTLNDIVLWSNGTDNVMSSTDGITWTARASLPKAKVIIHNTKNRIMFLNQPSDPGRVDWSDINDPLTVGASSYQWIGKNDNQRLLGCGSDEQGNLIFFKERNVYSISDITSGMVSVDPIGTLPFTNHRTIATTENSLLVAGVDGIYEVSGGVINRITSKINWVSGRNRISQYDSWCAVYQNGIYRLAMPNAIIDTTYNSQEWLINKKIMRGDASQPYPVTRNARYIGCYGTEDYDSGVTTRRRIYFGDSRSTAPSGSPASDTDIFAYINDTHDSSITQGLNGSAQSCYFTTKFFTENMPYLVKRFKKFIARAKIDNDVNVIIGYRFDPEQVFTETIEPLETLGFGFVFSNGSEGGFDGGIDFSYPSVITFDKDLESGTEPRGIQFKISWSSITDVSFNSILYNFLTKFKL